MTFGQTNEGKDLIIVIDNEKWQRFPLSTHIIKSGDDMKDIIEKYAKPYLKEHDVLYISERIVAISQGRSYPIKDIKPGFWAKTLVRFVFKSPHGIGLGSPWTMELAIKEAGIFRILLASFVSAITKPFGIKGLFYMVAGHNINAIDGPCSYTLPPYNEYAKLGPKDPDKVARELKEYLGNEVVIIDANDLGVNVLGRSNKNIDTKFCESVFRDNPLGQSKEQTPMCIVRAV